MLNGYGFGGYLIGAGVRPFIDGRADMYGDAFLDLYGKIAAGDRQALDDALTRWRVAWTIFPPSEPIVAVIDREPGWRRLYADKFAVVQVREDAPGAEGLRQGELRGGAGRAIRSRPRAIQGLALPRNYPLSPRLFAAARPTRAPCRRGSTGLFWPSIARIERAA